MTRPRLLLTGSSGFLGGYLLESLATKYELHAAFRSRPADVPSGASPLELDLGDPAQLEAAGRLAPSFVVHAAGFTDPDACQREPALARAVNATATRNLAEAVRGSCRRFLYCSTDLVFDGAHAPYRESDAPSPMMVYGQTKLDGETEARAVLAERVVVVRLALLYGLGRGRASKRSFTERMLADARADRSVRLFMDQFRSPLYIEDAARALMSILGLPDAPPLIHLGGPHRLSRYQQGLVALEVFGLDSALAVPVSMADVPARAPRPRDVSLDIELARSLGLASRPAREGLLAMQEAMGRLGTR
jgi:dTDP-4-dehydrorhamnose reductase